MANPIEIVKQSRQLFDQIDGEAFEFDEVKVTHGPKGPMALAPYWRMDVIRVLDCIDDDQSVIDGTPCLSDSNVLWYVRLIDIKMRLQVVGDAHAFRVRQGFGPVLDSMIADEIRRLKYRGLRFTPLQMPTFAETKRADIGSNSEYWRPQSPIKDYWDARNYLCETVAPGRTTIEDIKVGTRSIISFLPSPLQRRVAEAGRQGRMQ